MVCAKICAAQEPNVNTYQWKAHMAQWVCPQWGIIYVYVFVFGWAACILGIVGVNLACCVCCVCCTDVPIPAPPVPFANSWKTERS